LFTLYSVNFNALQIAFNKNSRESTAKSKKRQIFKQDRRLVEFSWNIRKQTGISLDLSRAAFAKVMMAYINHGKASSAKRNSGRKPKLSERNRRKSKSIEYKNHRNAAPKLTAVLNINS